MYDVVKSKLVYKGKVMEVYDDEITLPNGKTTIRETVMRGNAVAIVPVDKDGNIYFVNIVMQQKAWFWKFRQE